jgi:phosphoribosylformylglycinamidine (FGAM) synthase PurS component
MHKFMAQIKNMVALTLFALILASCSNANESDDLFGRWVMTEIVYDDGSVNQLEAGNFVDINANTITEVIKGYGNRQYSYTRQDKVLTLTVDDEQITWQILSEATHRLEIATPIGKYALTR